MKFKYKFKKSMYALFIVMYILAVICFVWNFIRLIQSISSGISLQINGYISVALCLALPIVISFFLTAMLISSYYQIGESKLTVKFGFLKDEYLLSDIDNVIKNVRIDKLVINFKDESSLTVIIDKAEFDEFSASIIKKNKSVQYGESDE